MPIRVLPPEVVSQIAAGEVIERPAAVVKELVENSLDAGATRVTVEVRGGGINLIRVADNGVGVCEAEAELAFQRYATSKISSPADLHNITTLGFRGEALPSIATVAQVKLLSRTAAETLGTYLLIEEGNLLEKGKRGAPVGTIVAVQHLFRSVPARLKFLKSSATENGHIIYLLHQYSLAFPQVQFSLVLEGKRVLHTSGKGDLREALAQVYGAETAIAMLEIPPNPRVSGYIGPPSLSRSSRGYMSFFLNHRWVRSGVLSRAVEEAYQGLLVERFPIAVVNISLPPEEVDVNVHPTKREVRFQREREVFAMARDTVQQTLAQAPLPQIKLLPSFPPPQGQVMIAPAPQEKAPSLLHTAEMVLPILRVLGQLANTYIIAEGPDGLYLLDQHAAHERVVFEKMLTQRAREEVEVQGLLEPVTVELTAPQEERLEKGKESLAQFGFVLEPFGNRTYLLRAVPASFPGEKVPDVIKELLDSWEGDSPIARWEERIAISIACHTAVKAGQPLSPEEMRELVRQLEQAASPRSCPHGRPTMVHLSAGQLDKEFGRI